MRRQPSSVVFGRVGERCSQHEFSDGIQFEAELRRRYGAGTPLLRRSARTFLEPTRPDRQKRGSA